MKGKLMAFIERHTIEQVYVLVQWPDVQDFMEEEWFAAEGILYQAFPDQEHLDSAYFIPLKRILK
jgi:hypothetical protein